MINVTRIVDKSVLEKLDIDLLLEQLPEIDQDLFIIFCATRQERKEDHWVKDGVQYIRIVLDFETVVNSSNQEVVEMMDETLSKKLTQLEII